VTSLIVIALIAAAALGAPLFAVIGAGALVGAHFAGLDWAVLVVEINRLASSPHFIAIPLFIFAGVVLARGGAPQRLVALAMAWLGWLPGGMAIVAIMACAGFAAFTGASGITILALGGLLFPALRHAGYGERFALGLVTASGAIGLLFAPSLAVILYALVANVSIDDLFLAGLVPGALLLALFAIHGMLSPHHAVTREPFAWRAAIAALRAGLWDLLLPVGVMAAILSGTITVSEAAALTAVYALALEGAIHRTLKGWGNFQDRLTEAGMLCGGLLVLLGVGMALTSLLVDVQAPMLALRWIEGVIGTPILFLVALNVFLLAVGCVMDIFSAIVVVAPLIVPIAARYGIDPVHLGVVFLANLEIGYLTPPVGINLFLAMQRFERPLLEVIRAVAPFMLIMLAWLLLVTYLPAMSLWWR
jgi:tripartite ATP-independent transporter DctM subunit